MRIVSFNVQNLRLRRPGGRARLDGARDHDMPEDATPEARALDLADRRLTAKVLARADADVVCLQEVFDRATLDFFHDHLLRHEGVAPFPYRLCLPGNDGGGRNLAVMSRHPLQDVASHAHLMPADLGLAGHPGARQGRPVFCRDCLMLRVAGLELVLCHFKAPAEGGDDRAGPDPVWAQRRLEALAVRRLIEARLGARPAAASAQWLVLGDLNEPLARGGQERAITPLLPPFSVDLVARMEEGERWTWVTPDGIEYARPDAMLASKALAARFPAAVPFALREGLAGEVARYGGPRLDGVGAHRPHASDHAALAIDLPGL
ncbi:MAG: endonuclease/exonuclease/phosphatase family protein [Pararhodobacter sp.]|nr:endonuclease/exonuclease/phosphatase family protein [Pararhodobacter sp.]